ENDNNAGKRTRHAHQGAQPSGGALRFRSDRNSPLAGKIPKPVAEMERTRDDSDDVSRHIQRIRHILSYSGVTRNAMSAKSFGVEVPADKNKGNQSRPALQQVHPVRHPGMAQCVGFPLRPNIKAIKAVEKYRNP